MGIYTADQIKAARQADLVAWLQSHGYNLKREGQNWRVPGHAGLIVQGNHYKHFSTEIGGNSLDFLTDILGYKFLDAVRALIHAGPAQQPPLRPVPTAKEELSMPVRGQNHRRVIAYLTKTRGLPVEMVLELIRARLLYQDILGNCVFPCRGPDGAAKGAIIRGTYSDVRYVARAPGSDASYGWYWPHAGESDRLVVIEACIDAMSLVVLRPEYRLCHILALGGLIQSDLDRWLSCWPSVKTVVLALDNDQPGLDADHAWSAELAGKGYDVQICFPDAPAKDWNELLILNSL